MPEEADITHDTLLRGRVRLLQPRHGFRSSLDPVLLAGFIGPPFGDFLDIGCASGALSFLLLAEDANARGVGVEIQPRLAALAEQGCAANGFVHRFRVVTGDIRAKIAVAAQAFDLVATNPPFRPVGEGKSTVALRCCPLPLKAMIWPKPNAGCKTHIPWQNVLGSTDGAG